MLKLLNVLKLTIKEEQHLLRVLILLNKKLTSF